MVDHVGIIVLLVVLLVAPALGVFALRVRSLSTERTASHPDSEDPALEDPTVGLPFLAGVLIYLLILTLALLLVLWALAFHEVGLLALFGLLIPVLIGLIHAGWVGALKW